MRRIIIVAHDPRATTARARRMRHVYRRERETVC